MLFFLRASAPTATPPATAQVDLTPRLVRTGHFDFPEKIISEIIFGNCSEVFPEIANIIRPILDTSSKVSAVMRTNTGGRPDFWTLENRIAGRGRRYHRAVIDEAFHKDGDNKTDGSMMEVWEKSINPTLYGSRRNR
jgi:hypothetical protein